MTKRPGTTLPGLFSNRAYAIPCPGITLATPRCPTLSCRADACIVAQEAPILTGGGPKGKGSPVFPVAGLAPQGRRSPLGAA